MKLTKIIPARRHTVTFFWHKPFQEMSDNWREIRSKSKRPMDTCFWCKHKFVNGEMIHLAARVKGRNVVLCTSCADNIE